MAEETVPCSEHVKDQLEELKKKEEHQTYDSVLRTLLGNYDG